MSRPDPTMRFIGVPADSDPLTLLGLDPSSCSGPVVDAALVSRLARIYDHPDGRSSMAEAARATLRDAASRLKDPDQWQDIQVEHASRREETPAEVPIPSTSATPPSAASVELTTIQVQLMQVLASCGGWNAVSRSRLASIGAMHGLSPLEMVDELRGLTSVVRLSALPAAATRPAWRGSSSQRAMEPGFVERVVGQYAPELRASDNRSLIKLCFLFGGLGILALLLMLRLLLVDTTGGVQQAGTLELKQSRDAMDMVAGESGGGSVNQVPLAPFTSTLVLPLKPLPAEVLDDVDASSETIQTLYSLSRHAVGMEDIDRRMKEEWERAIDVASTGWFGADPTTAKNMRKAMAGVLEVTGSNPRLAGPLLGALAPPSPGVTAEPLSIPRGAWQCGMTSALVGIDTISPAARSLATQYVRASLGRQAIPDTFNDGVLVWLSACIPSLVESLDVRATAAEAWKLWFRCLAVIDDGPGREAILLKAARQLLETQADLSRPEVPQMVLGRLLVELDWDKSAGVRSAVLGWFVDPAISSTDLWVLGSSLATIEQTPWYERRFVVAPDADLPMRRRIQARLAQAWPRPTAIVGMPGRGIPEGFDPQLAETWLSLLKQARAVDRDRGTLPMLHRLLLERLLAEAADGLVTGHGGDTLSVLNELEGVLEQYDDLLDSDPRGFNRDVTSLGGRVDGQWARLYGVRARNRADKIDMMQELERHGGDDLGPIDADLLASEALTANIGVREAAHYLIETRYSLGPNMAQAMVDRLPQASATVDVTGLIESLTGAELPRPSATRWPIEARLAMVNHALALRLNESGQIDALSESLARSMRRESKGLGWAADPAGSPEASAHALTAAWQNHLETLQDGEPWPWGREWEDRHTARLMLSGDSLQRFLVEQIAMHELLVYWMKQVQPDATSMLDELQSDLVLKRDRAVHVVEQMLLTETAVVELWSIRIRFILSQLQQGGRGGGT